MIVETTKQLVCECCGKKTPATIVSVSGDVIITVYCRNCKHLNTF